MNNIPRPHYGAFMRGDREFSLPQWGQKQMSEIEGSVERRGLVEERAILICIRRECILPVLSVSVFQNIRYKPSLNYQISRLLIPS